jgi:hypothetical protein
MRADLTRYVSYKSVNENTFFKIVRERGNVHKVVVYLQSGSFLSTSIGQGM